MIIYKSVAANIRHLRIMAESGPFSFAFVLEYSLPAYDSVTAAPNLMPVKETGTSHGMSRIMQTEKTYSE
jgi:hypothetical protein